MAGTKEEWKDGDEVERMICLERRDLTKAKTAGGARQVKVEDSGSDLSFQLESGECLGLCSSMVFTSVNG